MLKEFKEFAMKGNLIDVAVGLVLALAFTAVVNAFIDGIVMPLIAAIFGKPSFDAIVWTIGSGRDATQILDRHVPHRGRELPADRVGAVPDREGRRTGSARPAEEPTGPTEVELLTQIRDSLASLPELSPAGTPAPGHPWSG